MTLPLPLIPPVPLPKSLPPVMVLPKLSRPMADFDSLPDSLLCIIFSMLGLAQTLARCSAVCRRWNSLCLTVDTLTFESFQLFENRAESKRKASCIQDVVSGMLLKSDGVRNLKIAYHPVVWPWIDDDHFSEEKVCAWLEHVQPSLERLTLVDPNLSTPQPSKLVRLSDCRKLQWLNLCYGSIPGIPVECRHFSLLRSCWLDLIAITDAALADFVRLCPLLEDLKLNSCPGLQSPRIKAENLRSLEFLNNLGNVAPIQCVCVNAPKLGQVSLSYVKELITQGEVLSKLVLMCHVKPQIQSLPSLKSLHMHGHNWELHSISDYIRLGTAIEQLHIDVKLEAKLPLRMDHFLGHLQNLRSLYIGSDFFKCLQAGSMLSANFRWMNLPLLDDIVVVINCGTEACIRVLSTFLKCSNSLKRLYVNAEPLENSSQNSTFFNQVLALQRSYPRVEITLACPQSLL